MTREYIFKWDKEKRVLYPLDVKNNNPDFSPDDMVVASKLEITLKETLVDKWRLARIYVQNKKFFDDLDVNFKHLPH